MTVDHRHKNLDTVRSNLSFLLSPIQYLVNMPVSIIEWTSENFSTRKTLLEENSRLRARNLILNAKLQKLDAIQTENVHLRDLLDSSKKINEKVVIAEILTVDLAPFSRQIVINKGSQHKVYQGQPLLGADGVMGQVVNVGPLTSTAMLITDPSHSIPVFVNRNNLRSLLIGTGDPYSLDMPYIPNNADIKVGDLLISSGLGGHFPPNYPVAKITSIEPDPGQPYAKVTAEPTTQLQRSRETMLVFINMDNEEGE